MPKIYVKKAFKLQHNGEVLDFPVGNHTVDKEVAEHWFVKAHTGEEPAVDPDSAAAADELLAELDAKAKGLQELADKLAEREKAADKRDAELAAREAAVVEREKAADAKQPNKK